MRTLNNSTEEYQIEVSPQEVLTVYKAVTNKIFASTTIHIDIAKLAILLSGNNWASDKPRYYTPVMYNEIKEALS